VLDLADELGSLRMRGEVLMGIGVYEGEDDPAGTFDAFVESAEVARRSGDRHLEMVVLPNLPSRRSSSAGGTRRRTRSRGSRPRSHPMTREAVVCCEASLAAHRGDPTAGLEHLETVIGDIDAIEMLRCARGSDACAVRAAVGRRSRGRFFDEAMGAVALEPGG
jgi:hypothetical protein